MLSQLAGFSGGMLKATASGDSLLTPATIVNAVDAVDTVTVDKIHAGVVQYTAFSAGRNLTTDTAANIIAAFPEMDIGDSIMFCVSLQAAFAGTWVAGTGVTLAGRPTTPASSFSLVVIKKLTATTVEWRVL